MKRIAFALLLFFSLHLNAQCLLTEVPLSQRTSASSLIVEGKVSSTRSFWNDDRTMIYTRNTIEVYKVFKGSLSTASIDVITEGGTVGFDMIKAEPSLALARGETGIFLCESARAFRGVRSAGLPLFETYASAQGFIRYDESSATAADVFKTYGDVENELYRSFSPGLNYRVVREYTLRRTTVQGQRTLGTITGFSPASITAGTGAVLTINGSGFGATQGTGTVGFKNGNNGGSGYINPLPTQYLSWSDNQITVQVPAGAGSGTVQVTQGTTATSAASLTITYAHLNVSYDLGTGTKAWPTQHVDDNEAGGYTWQMNTAFNTSTAAKASFMRAFNTWRCNTGINWTIGATTSVSTNLSDGTNVITFDNASTPLSAGVLGTCYSYFSGCSPDGVTMAWWVRELDIVFDDGSNITPLTWQYGTAAPTSSQYDFETVVVHELGHGHQLGHVISSGAIMHYAISNGAYNRNLSANDLAGGNFVQGKSLVMNGCDMPPATAFGSCATLPIGLSFIGAYKKAGGIQVEWKNQTESEVMQYEVERSADGLAFTKATVVLPKANNGQSAGYEWFDQNAGTGKNYYRIQSVGYNRQTKYSDVVSVTLDREKETLVAYPNPVKGNQVMLQLNNLAEGRYGLYLYNAAGQLVVSKSVETSSRNGTEKLTLSVPARGLYLLRLQGNGVDRQKTISVDF